MSEITYEATMDRVEKVGLSTNGNPTFAVYFKDHESARTITDGSVAYQLPNPEFGEGTRVRVRATSKGRIIDIEAL